MSSQDYLHGYTLEEKQRLIEQAKFWQDSLILREVDFPPGSKILEIGCGVGAVLGIIGQNYPDVKLAGIDLDSSQIDFARNYLNSLNLHSVDLKIGDATKLPWNNNSFDYVYGIWILEHIKNPLPILKEAFRVLKPGGKIILNETDLMTLLVYPDSEDYTYLQRTFFELLNYTGNAYIGRMLGFLLRESGFTDIKNTPWGYHYFQPSELQLFIPYVTELFTQILEPASQKLNKNIDKLKSGLSFFQSLVNLPESSVTVTVYRAVGVKNN
jgi:ubiquinone/menaquinone biosynthesis C-methylase UbiE